MSIDGTETCHVECLSSIARTRDAYLMRYVDLLSRHERDLMEVSSKHNITVAAASTALNSGLSSEQQQQTASMHLVVEIADWKSKIRKKNQEL